MAKKRVPLHQNPRGFVDVDPDATNGAQVGVNLRGPDGQILTAAQVINPTTGGSGGPSSIASTIWKLIREVPSNIQKLAALIGAGFAVRKNDGEWALRTLQEGTGIDIANPDGDAGNPMIGLEDVADSGAGSLLAISKDSKGRVTGTRPATITGTAQQIDVANGNAAAGLPTISLADLPNSGAGSALVKITRDAKGRISGTQSATTDDLAEGATNLYFTTARAVAASPVKSVNARIGMVSVPDYVAKSTAPTATDFGRALIDGDRWLNTANGFTYTRYGSTWLAEAGANLTPPKGYIDGFKMIWNSAGSITFDSGTAYVESLGINVLLNAAVTKTVSGLTPNTFYHNYLFTSAGVADIEISSTAPASPYNGTARSKTGDASRRYIGSFLTTAAGDIRRFVQSETEVSYLDTLGAVPYRILAAGSATTPTAVSVLPAAPVTAVQFKGQLINNTATGFFVISAPGGMLEIISVAQNSRVVQYLPIFNSQMFYYNTAAGGSSFIDLHAYVFER